MPLTAEARASHQTDGDAAIIAIPSALRTRSVSTERRAGSLSAVAEDREGNLWVATNESGLYRLDRQEFGNTADDLAAVYDNSPVGYLPEPDDIDTSELDISAEAMRELTAVDLEHWFTEMDHFGGYLDDFGDRLAALLDVDRAACPHQLNSYEGDNPEAKTFVV